MYNLPSLCCQLFSVQHWEPFAWHPVPSVQCVFILTRVTSKGIKTSSILRFLHTVLGHYIYLWFYPAIVPPVTWNMSINWLYGPKILNHTQVTVYPILSIATHYTGNCHCIGNSRKPYCHYIHLVLQTCIKSIYIYLQSFLHFGSM